MQDEEKLANIINLCKESAKKYNFATNNKDFSDYCDEVRNLCLKNGYRAEFEAVGENVTKIFLLPDSRGIVIKIPNE